ncbi:MAG: chromosome condensation protein CrcB [Naasia sp.]|nr:chromosome condensation protein CrcB [Naasia sp.]
MIGLLAAVAGGLGAAARFLLDGLVQSRTHGRYPLGIFVVNASGSFLLGLLAGLIAASALPDAWRTVVGAGFLGGYTTFSAAAVEVVILLRARRYGAAMVHAAGMLLACTALAACGWGLGGAL